MESYYELVVAANEYSKLHATAVAHYHLRILPRCCASSRESSVNAWFNVSSWHAYSMLRWRSELGQALFPPSCPHAAILRSVCTSIMPVACTNPPGLPRVLGHFWLQVTSMLPAIFRGRFLVIASQKDEGCSQVIKNYAAAHATIIEPSDFISQGRNIRVLCDMLLTCIYVTGVPEETFEHVTALASHKPEVALDLAFMTMCFKALKAGGTMNMQYVVDDVRYIDNRALWF